jgi:hypothetical protein
MLALGQCFSLSEKVVWRCLTNDETAIAGSQIVPYLDGLNCRRLLRYNGNGA